MAAEKVWPLGFISGWCSWDSSQEAHQRCRMEHSNDPKQKGVCHCPSCFAALTADPHDEARAYLRTTVTLGTTAGRRTTIRYAARQIRKNPVRPQEGSIAGQLIDYLNTAPSSPEAENELLTLISELT